MSLTSLTSVHTVEIRPLVESRDNSGANKRVVSTQVTGVHNVRVVPLSIRQVMAYQAAGLQASHAVYADHSIGMDERHVLVFQNQVYRYVEERNADFLNRLYRVVVRHDEVADVPPS